ncbi:putative FEN1-fatty acid elongase [Mycena epipterygia]|nr:putative FEN1-fatty acid elongase [Mycena epipterygia]
MPECALVVAALCTYLLLIFSTQAIMKKRAPWHPRRLMQAYNITMSGVSLLLLVRMLEELRPLLRRVGIVDAICAEESWTEKLELYYRFNYTLKYVELLDTVFLVLSKKKLRFLHVYHHSSTIFLCYVQLRDRSAMSWVAITGNLFVHVILYYYYFITSNGYQPSWKKHLTALQITQFLVVGSTVLSASTVSHFSATHKTCSITPFAASVGAFILSSYLLLFVEFYFTAYVKKARKLGGYGKVVGLKVG